jgi:hypothetical protein
LATVDPEELLVHAKLEASYIVFQLRPHHANFSKRLVKAPKLYFYDAGVDVIIEEGGRLVPVEIKSGKTVARDFFLGLEKWTALAGALSFHPTLVYGGKDSYQHKKVSVVGWKDAAHLPKTAEPGRCGVIYSYQRRTTAVSQRRIRRWAWR